MKERILFIGAGKMAGAIAGGLVRRDAAMARVITAFDPNPAAVETFKENTQANAVSSDVVGLADKAQVIDCGKAADDKRSSGAADRQIKRQADNLDCRRHYAGEVV